MSDKRKINIKWNCPYGHEHDTEGGAVECILHNRRIDSFRQIDIMIALAQASEFKVGEIWLHSSTLQWLSEQIELRTETYIDSVKGAQQSTLPYYRKVLVTIRDIVPQHDAWLICQEKFVILPADLSQRRAYWLARADWAISLGENAHDERAERTRIADTKKYRR